MRILIVDDDEMTCLGLRKWITDMGLRGVDHVDATYSAEEAVAFSHQHRVNILITDIQMVNMNGLKLIESAKKDNPGIVAIIITAHASFPYAHRAIQLGVKSFLLKPFGKEELQSALVNAISTMKPEDARSETTNPIAFAMAYVREHLDTEVNMALIANKLNLSYTYFSKLFKQETGKNFLNYVVEIKMQEAAKLLQQKMSIGEIAERLGYVAQQSFSRAFSNYWGCSPYDYRKRDGKPSVDNAGDLPQNDEHKMND